MLGISDPTPATGDGGPDDGMIDSHIDAPPPCTTSIALQPEMTTELGKTGMGFVIGRFNNGLEEDIAVATGADVTILHGNRTGAFGGDGDIDVLATAAVDLVVEDFDGIGFDDLVTWTPTTVVAHIANRALDPPFDPPEPLVGTFTNVQRVVQEQLDGNARADVMVYDAAAGSKVYTSNAVGPAAAFSTNNNLVGVAADELLVIRQIDAAQRADAIFANGTTVKLSLQTTAGFQALNTVAMGSRNIAVGRFDTDNQLDIVVSTPMGLVLYRQGAPGLFNMHGVISPLVATAPMLVTDLNDDGRDDIVLTNVAILQCAPANNVGVFTQVEALDATRPAKFADVTGDGKADLVRLSGTTVKVRVR